MNYEWIGKTLKKKILSTKLRNIKNQSEIAACEQQQKPTREKANFCSNTVFSLYFKNKSENLRRKKKPLFRSTSCFGVTKITTPI